MGLHEKLEELYVKPTLPLSVQESMSVTIERCRLILDTVGAGDLGYDAKAQMTFPQMSPEVCAALLKQKW